MSLVQVQSKESDVEKSPERQTESVTVEIQPKEPDDEKSPERVPETVSVQVEPKEFDDKKSPERQRENVTSKDALGGTESCSTVLGKGRQSHLYRVPVDGNTGGN